MAPTISPNASPNLEARTAASNLFHRALTSVSTNTLTRRAERTSTPGKLTVSPYAIPNKAVFALFGLIGAGFVITGIWFFFRAKNGGFYFTDHDFSDYKSSVLRRKGPNGTTLSGATESTDLGGGSVYKDVESTVGSEMSELSEKKRRKRKTKMRGGEERPAERDLESQSGRESRRHDDDVRAYRHEKPARVGGINRAPDSTAWEGSDATTDLLSNRQTTPTSSPAKVKKGGGIRKVSSSASTFWTRSQRTGRTETRGKRESREREERERIREEAKKLQEKGRAAKEGRRDFSYAEGDDATTVVSEQDRREEERREEERREQRRARREARKSQSRSPEKRDREKEQRLLAEDDGDLGTKTYSHFIPGLSVGTPSVQTAPSEADTYADERRKKRGYRRGRRGSLSERE